MSNYDPPQQPWGGPPQDEWQHQRKQRGNSDVRQQKGGDDELHLDGSTHDAGQRLADQRAIAVIQPVPGETIRSGDAIAVVVDLDKLGVLQPGLEVGRGEGDLQLAEGGAPHLLRIHQSRFSEPKPGWDRSR